MNAPHRLSRNIDRIDTGSRFTAEDAARLNAQHADSDATTLLRDILQQEPVGRVAIVSSFGAESAVLLHLAAQVDPGTPVLFLDTHKHFEETLRYRDDLVAHLGLTDLRILEPDEAEVNARDETGLRWSYDPDGCCELRKVRPLARALASFDATLTGRKAFQAATRAQLPRFEIDSSDAAGRLKINPLIDWNAARIDGYFEEHALPRHPLVERGFPSIGCAPCTHKVAPGEDPRSGRWKGWDKVECGIHQPGEEPFL